MRPERAEELFRKYADGVYRQCFVILGNEKDCEDAVQEVFLRLIRSDPAFTDERGERAWLIVTACNYCKSQLRRSKYRVCSSIEEIPENTGVDNDVSGSDEVLDAVMSLPPAQREAVYLRYYEDMSAENIAKLTGTSASTVRSRLHFAIRKLRKLLGGDFYG